MGVHTRLPRRLHLIIAACAVAALSAGCGTATTTGGAVATPAASVHLARPSGRLLAEIGVVCRAVRGDAPHAMRVPKTRAGLTRYAVAAQAPARRTFVSLQRLAARPGGSGIGPLVTAYAGLSATYEAAPGLARGRSGAPATSRLVATRESALTALSESLGVPSCGVSWR